MKILEEEKLQAEKEVRQTISIQTTLGTVNS